MDPQGAVLGNAIGYVDINTSGVSTNLNRAKQDFNNFISQTGSMMQSWGSQIAGFGQNLTLWTAPVALAVGTGLNAAADFNSVLTEIQARTGLTVEAMNQVKQAALDYGATSMFSSQQAADAFLTLLTAGLDVESALATLGPVLNAAAAGNIDLGTAADLTTTIMASFSLEASEATRIVDAMSRASAASPAGLYDIGVALADVGGDARTFGLSLEQTSAALAILAQNGKVGTEGATQLRSIFTAMTSTSSETAKAWDMVGSSLFDANGNARDFSIVLSEIEAGLQNLSAEDQAFVIQQLAGSYGRVGFNALLASDGIDAMITTMATQSDAATVAEMQMESFRGVVDAFKGSMETLWITVMTPYMNNVIRPMIGRKTELVNQITAWAAVNEPLVQTIMQIVGAFLTLGPILVGVGVAMQVVGGALSTIGAAIGFLLSPMALLIAGAAGLAYIFREPLLAAFQAFATRVQSGMNVFFGLIDNGVPALTAFQTALGSAFGSSIIFQRAVVGFNLLRNVVSATVAFIREAFGILVNRDFVSFGSGLQEDSPIFGFFFGLRDAVTTSFERISAVIAPAWEAISGFFTQNTDALWQFAQGFMMIPSLFNPIGQMSLVLRAFGFDAITIFESVVGGVTRFFDVISGGGSMVDGLRAAFGNNEIFNGFLAILTNQVFPALESLRAWFLDTVAPNIGNFITTSLIPTISSFGNILGNLWAIVGPPLFELGAWFLTTGMPAIMQTIERFTNYLASIGVGEGMRMLVDWFLNSALPAVASYLDTTIIPNVQAFIGLIQGIWDTVSPALFSLWDWFMASGLPGIIGQIIDFFTPSLTDIINIISTIWTVVSPALDAFKTGLQTAFQWIVDNGVTVLQTAWNTFAGLLTGAWTNISGGIETLKTNLSNAFNWIKTNVIDPVVTAVQNLLNLLGGVGTAAQNAATAATGAIGNATNGYQVAGNAIGQIGGGLMSGQYSAGQVAGAFGSAIGNIFGFAQGINFVPNDMIAQIHQGEAVIPASMNPFNPNSQQNGMGGGIHIENVNITGIRTYEEGREAGRGFREELGQVLMERDI